MKTIARQRFFVLLIGLWQLCCLSWSFAMPQERYPFQDDQLRDRFQALMRSFRCVSCQNQDLSESNAMIAERLRETIYKQIVAGQTDQDITQYLLDRYGSFVLLRPPLMPGTWLLWLMPFMALVWILMQWLFKYGYRKQHEHTGA